MFIIDPHCHMVSRTTADYEAMALAGVVAISEPAFWAGFDRSPAGFVDYYRQLTEFEPKRAAQFGIDHYCWICLNPKEAEDLGKAREVLGEVPKFLSRPTVLGVGEIGLNKNTPNEAKVFGQHVQLAIDCFGGEAEGGEAQRHKGTEALREYDGAATKAPAPLSALVPECLSASSPKHHLILIHTPHLEDKLKGTRMILDMLKDFGAIIEPGRVLIDHVEEHTIKMVLDQGYWAGMTLYPTSKCTPQRAVDMIEMYGAERLMVNAAADWGVSDPMQTQRAMLEAKKRGHSLETLMRVFYNNPATFMGQNAKFKPRPMKVSCL